MKTIAYFIDPLLSAQPDSLNAGFLEALLPLFNRLPEYRHVIISGFSDLDWEEGITGEAELVAIPLPKFFIGSKKNRLLKGLHNWLNQEKPAVFVSFDKEAIQQFPGKSLLISSASELLDDSHGKRLKKLPVPSPNWTGSAFITVPFNTDRDQLLRFLPGMDSRIGVVYPALQPDCSTISWSEQETLKIRHSGGRDFFLYAGPLHAEEEIVQLLKSYSLLKKWLMTGMPLILAGPSTDETARLQSLLKTYKYRADVTLLPDPDANELSTLVAGTYLLSYPYREGFATWPIEWAISAGTPLLTTDHDHTREICGDAAWYAAPGDLDAWAHQMMLLYKDEHQRSQLIEKQGERHKSLNQPLTLERYEAIIRELSA